MATAWVRARQTARYMCTRSRRTAVVIEKWHLLLGPGKLSCHMPSGGNKRRSKENRQSYIIEPTTTLGLQTMEQSRPQPADSGLSRSTRPPFLNPWTLAAFMFAWAITVTCCWGARRKASPSFLPCYIPNCILSRFKVGQKAPSALYSKEHNNKHWVPPFLWWGSVRSRTCLMILWSCAILWVS